MKSLKRMLILMILVSIIIVSTGCKKHKDSKFANINSICEYAVLKCYYHNVANFVDDGKQFIIKYGNKKAWIEYTGLVEIGIDANKVKVDVEGKDNVLVTLPHAKILSVYMDSDSIKENWTENGLFSEVNAEDKASAISEAQKDMENTAMSNESLINQGENRAKSMIEGYINNVGRITGKQYSISWNFID